MWMRMVLIAALLAPAAGAGAVTLYQWVDEQGGVHFADRPPEKEPPGGYEGPKPPTVGEALEREREEAERRRREEEAARRAREAEEARRRAAEAKLEEPRIESPYTCEQARAFSRFFARGDVNLYRRDPGGRFRPTTPAERQATASQWREAVTLLCREQAAAGNSAQEATEQ